MRGNDQAHTLPAAIPKPAPSAGLLPDLIHGMRPASAGLIIIAAIFLAHLPALDASFLFDDYRYFVNEPAIRSLALPWKFMAGNTRPLLFMTLAIDHALHGMNARWFHFTNILILCLSCLALFGIVRRTLRKIKAFADSAPGLALVAALAWGTHPLQTNLTCYVWQRGEMLMALFYLLTLYCFIRATEQRAASLPASRAWYCLGGFSCLLGMLSKEVMVTAPLMVLLYDRAFVAGSFGRALRARSRLYAGLAGTWVVFFVLLKTNASGFHGNVGVGFHSVIYSPVQYALTMPGVLAHYLRLALVPIGLCFDPNWPIARSTAEVLMPLVLVGPLLALVGWAMTYYPRWAFCGAWFFLVLAPTSSFMPMPDPLLEYRLHLPLAGVLVLALVGLSTLAGRARWLPRDMPAAVAVLLLVSLGASAHYRCKDYHTEARLWADTFAQRPNNIRAFSNLWLALKKSGRLEDAANKYARLAQNSPQRTDAPFFLGYSAMRKNNLPLAQRWFERTLRLDPTAFMAIFHLGEIAGQQGRMKTAAEHYLHALRLRPLFVQANLALGKIFEHAGQLDQALKHYNRAIMIAPKWGEPYAYKGRVFIRQGKVAAAVKLIRAAVKRAPENRELREWLREAQRLRGGEAFP